MGNNCCRGRPQETPTESFVSNSKDAKESLKSMGLRDLSLVIGIDYTASNEYHSIYSLNTSTPINDETDLYENLHWQSPDPSDKNPYEQVLESLPSMIDFSKSDPLIPVFIYGDSKTRQRRVRALSKDHNIQEEPIEGIENVIKRYKEVTPTVKTSGPTTYKPLIEKSIEIQRRKGGFLLLVIIGDGPPDDYEENIEALRDATNYPIGVLVIGVGDHEENWELMPEFLEEAKLAKLDNVFFVHYTPEMSKETLKYEALRELPALCRKLKQKKLLSVNIGVK